MLSLARGVDPDHKGQDLVKAKEAAALNVKRQERANEDGRVEVKGKPGQTQIDSFSLLLKGHAVMARAINSDFHFFRFSRVTTLFAAHSATFSYSASRS